MMLRDIWQQLDHPALAVLSLLIGLGSLPSLARFALGEDYRRARHNLGFGDRFQTQVTLLRLALHGNGVSLRALVFFGGYLIVSGAIYLLLVRLARLLA